MNDTDIVLVIIQFKEQGYLEVYMTRRERDRFIEEYLNPFSDQNPSQAGAFAVKTANPKSCIAFRVDTIHHIR